MVEDKSIIDIRDALNRALGDVAFLKMMFDEFVQTIPEALGSIQMAIEKGDMVQLSKSAHQFKGSSANLGAKGISEAAFGLERIGKSGNGDDAQNAYEHLQAAVNVFRQELSQIDWSFLSK
jgi:HPt (histidine-containing phosphotransfer) domain-containing protein